MIGYLFFRLFASIFGLLPMSFVYKISDGIAFLLHRVVKYRKAVVLENLARCFPDYSNEKRNQIAKDSYRNLADIMVEGIKGFSLSPDELRKRYQFKNLGPLQAAMNEGKSIIVVAAHYGNWEWGALAVAEKFAKDEIIGLYKPIKNARIDDFMRKTRSKFGLILGSIANTRQLFNKHSNNASAFLMVADQNPSNSNKAIWVDFFGNPTACLHGPEFYAKLFDMPVFYLTINRVKRGYYEVVGSTIEVNPKESVDGEITTRFMKTLETQLKEKPEDWLWSHKRWKHKPV